jgi:hypothetical protein
MLFVLLIVLASMIAISLLYFNDVGCLWVLIFWVAYVLGFGLLFLPFDAAGYILLSYQAFLAIGFYWTAKAAT